MRVSDSPWFLATPLPWLCAFAAVYALVLLATYAMRTGLFAAAFGLLVLIALTVFGSVARPGVATKLQTLLYGPCPKLLELGEQAAHFAEGGKVSAFPFVSTLLTTAGLLLCLVVAARRSER